MESLKHDHLQGAKLLEFQNDLLSDPALTALSAEVWKLTECSCGKDTAPCLENLSEVDELPPDVLELSPEEEELIPKDFTIELPEDGAYAKQIRSPKYTGKAVVSVGNKGTSPTQEPESVLTGLMARWQDLILSRLEERILQPAPQSTAGFYKAKPGKVDALRTHAQRLKASLRGTSLPTDKDAALARADWLELAEEATSLELRVPPVNHGIQDSAEWASATFAACNHFTMQASFGQRPF
jgi:hypothetical protein